MKISWNLTADKNGPLYCDIYRSSTQAVDTKDAKNILNVTSRNAVEYIDSTADGRQWYYAVTALDRAGNESNLSNVVLSEPALAASGDRKSSK